MTRSVLVLGLLVAVAGCSSSPSPKQPVPSMTTTSTTLGARPLHLPSVASAADCPVTPRRPWSGPGVATNVLGDGPLYPVADYFQDGTTLDLRAEDREPDGTYTKKVRWIGTGYTGPVLVRTARIDGPGTATMRFSYWGETRDGGYYADLPTDNSDLPATTKVGGPGCYAYQVDGSTFSTTIVFRAVAA